MPLLYLSCLLAFFLSGCDQTDHWSTTDRPYSIKVLGGSGSEYGRSLAQDNTGSIIIAGYSNSQDLAYDYVHAAPAAATGDTYNVIISKYQPGKERPVTAVLAGSAEDRAHALAVDEDNRIYVAGTTTSSDFPDEFSSPGQVLHTDIFISVLSPDLEQLISSRVIHGSGYDFIRDMAIDRNGTVYITGSTSSVDFPITENSYMKSIPSPGTGPWDIGLSGYVMRLSSDLSTILASTYIGGNGGDDHIYALALADNEDIYITGFSNSADFPVTDGAYDTSYNLSVDIIIARLDSQLRHLLAATYAGERHAQYGRDIAVAGNGDVYIAGEYHNRYAQNTKLAGAAQPYFGGGLNDIIVMRFDAGLSHNPDATYLGGKNDEYASAIETLEDSLIVTGYGASKYFPSLDPADMKHFTGGTYDSFTVMLDRKLDRILGKHRIGHRGNDLSTDSQLIGNSHLAIIGNSNSSISMQQQPPQDRAMDLTLVSVPLSSLTLPHAEKQHSRKAHEVQ